MDCFANSPFISVTSIGCGQRPPFTVIYYLLSVILSSNLFKRCVILVGAAEEHFYGYVGVLDIVVALGVFTLCPDADRDLLGFELVVV